MKSAANYNPKLWGKCGWQFLHYICLGYSNRPTEKDKEHYKNFILELGYVLPCAECRQNFIIHSKNHPIDNFLNNSQSLFKWIVKIQNITNKTNIDDVILKKYYVNENRRLEMKNCCGLEGKSKKLLEKLGH